MDCHEALMARRRKKTGRNPSSRSKLSSNILLDKSLPAIPTPEATIYPEQELEYDQPYVSPPLEVPSMSKTVNELRQPEPAPEERSGKLFLGATL